jgi:hypothetical protein
VWREDKRQAWGLLSYGHTCEKHTGCTARVIKTLVEGEQPPENGLAQPYGGFALLALWGMLTKATNTNSVFAPCVADETGISSRKDTAGLETALNLRKCSHTLAQSLPPSGYALKIQSEERKWCR